MKTKQILMTIMAAGAAWMIGTLFFCDYEAVAWTAQLRVRDNHTGRLVLSHDYVQRYETKVFGLIPLFGIAACQESSFDYMQSWCLSALTDRAVADVTAFLSGKHWSTPGSFGSTPYIAVSPVQPERSLPLKITSNPSSTDPA